MKLILASGVVWLGLQSQLVHAADVVYQLDGTVENTVLDSGELEPRELEIKNRQWLVSGVEQSSTYLEPPHGFDFGTGRRFRVSCLYVPDCVDDIAWPLTREVWRRLNDVPLAGMVLAHR